MMQGQGPGITRGELLRRGAVGFLAAPLLPRVLQDAFAHAGDVHAFVSRPDLKPPRLTATLGAVDDFVFLAPSSGPGARGAMIADGRGEVVWFHPVKKGSTVTDFKMQRLHGKPVLTWWEGTITDGLGDGHWVVVDSSYRQLFTLRAARGLPGDLHEFQITPEGTALVTTNELVRWQQGHVVGGVVQELALPSGRLVRDWHSLAHVPVSETAIAAKPGPRFDYFHVNSVDVDSDGDLIVSGRNVWAVYRIDRHSGRVLWRLGGKRSTFALGPGVRFYWQHDARHHAGGRLSIYDDGAAPAREPHSRAIVVKLDLRRKRATLEHAYYHRPQTVLAHYMGNAQLLPNGNMFVGWGGSPYVTEFAPDGSIVFDAALPYGGQSYRAFRFPWAGRPALPPDLAASAGALYASWNGATGVASWRLYEDGKPTAVAPRTGFETRLTPSPATRSAAVAALDAAGNELARSRDVSV